MIKWIILGDDPFVFFDTFGDAVFLTREEASAYAEGQERWQGVRVRKEAPRKRPWMALELEDIRKYATVKKTRAVRPGRGKVSPGVTTTINRE